MFDEIRVVIRKIPRGKVATYGAVAKAAGFPPRRGRSRGPCAEPMAGFRGTACLAPEARFSFPAARAPISSSVAIGRVSRSAVGGSGWMSTNSNLGADDIMEIVPMKQFLTIMFVCGAAFAQTKALRPRSPQSPQRRRKKRPPEICSIPSTMKARAARGLQGEVRHHARRHRYSSDASLGAHRRGPFLQSGARQDFTMVRRFSA